VQEAAQALGCPSTSYKLAANEILTQFSGQCSDSRMRARCAPDALFLDRRAQLPIWQHAIRFRRCMNFMSTSRPADSS